MSVGNKAASVSRAKLKPVSVKALVEFSAKSGSLDRRFTPAPTALEGIEGHKRVAANRSDDYQAEISLSIFYQDLLIRGRADGYQPELNCLEEIKTFHGEFEKIPTNHRALHWAQAKIYGWIFCTEKECPDITLALVYFNVATQKEHRLEQLFTANELATYGCALAEKYYAWQQQVNRRLASLYTWADNVVFPHAELHPSQRHMAESVYKAAATGRVLLAEAPTGTGKTLAGIFPAIKAFSKTPIDKIFYLTAKTTGKHLALENIQLITSDSTATPLRVLELTAQEKICLEPELRCAGDSCPFAESFYDKLADARQAACQIPVLNKQALTLLAQQYQICPFYLAMEMSRWVDIVVADYNYYFDGNAFLYGLSKAFNWHPYLLVDESHNLVERARQMYSAELSRGLLSAAKRQAPRKLKKALGRIDSIWLELLKELQFTPDKLTVLSAAPDNLNFALSEFTTQYLALLQQQPDHPMQQTKVQEFFFSVLHYQTIQELLNDDFCIDMQGSNNNNEILTLRNLIPAQLLAQRLAQAHSACFFSATLHPTYFYKTLLGLPQDTVCLQVSSPFSANQLNVHIAHKLSTRYRDRTAAIKPICNIIKQQLQVCSGNALVFFPSYEFLQQVQQQLLVDIAGLDVQLIAQAKKMSEDDRRLFIQQYTQHNNILGLAVLGGAFSEGIDLPGDALKGVFIATLGLPQVNPVTEYMRNFLQARLQQGYNFTYLYPGIQKVIQAAGRVIRTKKDRGYVWLLDDRFSQEDISKLLPEWWKLDCP